MNRVEYAAVAGCLTTEAPLKLPAFALLRLESFSSSPGVSVSVTTIFWAFLSHRVDYIWDEVRSAFFPPGARV